MPTYTITVQSHAGSVSHSFASVGDALYWAKGMYNGENVVTVKRDSDGACLWVNGETQDAMYTPNPAYAAQR